MPIDFILNTEMASEFRMRPVKLERVDIEIPGVVIYSQHKKFKKRRIILSSLAVKSLKRINFLFNYIVNDPDNGDLQYQIDKFIKRQKNKKF